MGIIGEGEGRGSSDALLCFNIKNVGFYSGKVLDLDT